MSVQGQSPDPPMHTLLSPKRPNPCKLHPLSSGYAAMPKLTLVAIAATLYATAALAVPDFAPTASSAWYAYSREWMPPISGPGPVTQDKSHPRVSNDDFRATGKQPTPPFADTSNPILRPWAADALRKLNAETLSGRPFISQLATCRPLGALAFVLEPMTRPMFIIQSAKEVTLINESFSEVRHVYLADRRRPNLKLSWQGDSIGHYEGDTLVIDTVGFNDKTYVDGFKTPHTTQLHTTERFHLVNGRNELQVDVHVEDTGAFTTAWNAMMRYRKFELVAARAKQTGVQLAALATSGGGAAERGDLRRQPQFTDVRPWLLRASRR